MIITKYGKLVMPDTPTVRAKCEHCRTKVILAQEDYEKIGEGEYLRWQCPFCQKITTTLNPESYQRKENRRVIILLVGVVSFFTLLFSYGLYTRSYIPKNKLDYEITFSSGGKTFSEVVDYYYWEDEGILKVKMKNGKLIEYSNANLISKRDIPQK